MLKINDIKILDRDIALYFGTSQQSLMNYKKSSDIKINRRYKAFRFIYIDFIKSLDAVQSAECVKNKVYFHKLIKSETIFDKLSND